MTDSRYTSALAHELAEDLLEPFRALRADRYPGAP